MALVPYQKQIDAWEEVKDKLRHEILPDLQGGDEHGHYHLTLEELEHLHEVSDEIKNAVDGVRHEKLPDLQGGKNGEHYHLTEAELTKLQNTPETIDIGTVTTGAAGTQASVISSGTATNVLLNFVIPKGDKGDAGQNGLNGKDGKAATISIGTTTTHFL